MKKYFIAAFTLFFLLETFSIVHAKASHKHDSKGMEQVMDHLVLDQLTDELNQAVKDYYKKDSIRIQYNWNNPNYDVVEIQQSEKGNELSHPYRIQITIQTYDNKKYGLLGTDSITFGVVPVQFNQEFDEKNVTALKVELVDYKHEKP